MSNRVKIPRLSSVEKAIELYYSTFYLNNKEISELFDKRSSSTVAKLKKFVVDFYENNDKCEQCAFLDNSTECKRCKEQAKFAILRNGREINTKQAYVAWGLDIKDLEYRVNKLQKFQKAQAVS